MFFLCATVSGSVAEEPQKPGENRDLSPFENAQRIKMKKFSGKWRKIESVNGKSPHWISLFFCKINGPMVRWSNGPIISILQFLRLFQFFESKNYILLSTYPGFSYVLTYFFVDFLTYWVRDILELQFESFLKKERMKWAHFFGKSSWKIRIKKILFTFSKNWVN